MAFIYLDNKELEYVLNEYLVFISAKIIKSDEEIESVKSPGRITSQAVYAAISSPHYLASAMDGIATNASKTFGATETTPVILKENEDFVRIDTGDPIPERFDAVIMIEDVIELQDGSIKLISAGFPWQHIRQIGEDICQGEMIIPSNTKIEPATIGALLAGGVSKINVWKKPVVGIIPTGDEIIKPTPEPEKGKIIEFKQTGSPRAGIDLRWIRRVDGYRYQIGYRRHLGFVYIVFCFPDIRKFKQHTVVKGRC